jgi:hypothetical protein
MATMWRVLLCGGVIAHLLTAPLVAGMLCRQCCGQLVDHQAAGVTDVCRLESSLTSTRAPVAACCAGQQTPTDETQGTDCQDCPKCKASRPIPVDRTPVALAAPSDDGTALPTITYETLVRTALTGAWEAIAPAPPRPVAPLQPLLCCWRK